MEWSHNHDRMMSVLERLENPKQYIEYYCCCFVIWRKRVRLSSTVDKYPTQTVEEFSNEEDLSTWTDVPYNSMTENPIANAEHSDK